MDLTLITLGAEAPNAALTLNRVALGTFLAISGYHKLFNASRHATLARTLQDDGVRAVPFMQWLVPGIEFSGGCALIIGLLSALAAFGLFMVCLGAVVLDAVKRVGAWQPLNRADLIGDLLYLPESLYCIGLAVDAGRAWTLEPRRCDCSAPRQLRYGARPSPTAKVRLGRRTSEPPTTA